MHSIREVNELLKKHLLPNVIHNKFKSGAPMNIWATCVTPRSSHRRCSVKNTVLKNFANFTGTPVLRSLFNKVAALHKIKRLQHRCLSVKFTKFLRTLIWRTSANDCFCTLKLQNVALQDLFFYGIRDKFFISTINAR